ncbi:MAG: 23S rRNA (adenine(2503)-C(2))-methyltransferase RlmN [Gammaproteobacteria bacterium]
MACDNLLGLPRQRLGALMAELGEKPFHAIQLMRWVHQRGVLDFDSMTNLSKKLRSHLKAHANLRLPEVVGCHTSVDGTRRWTLRVDAANCIEMVFIPEDGRGTLCISSQVGCALRCSFCATGAQGFNRNLTAAEIIGQVLLARSMLQPLSSGERPVTNVVFMGMGEPLLNFDNVVSALQLLMDDNAYGLSRRRITLSTAGVVPQIDELGKTCPVSLAVSLHAPDDTLRSELVPLNRKYPIATLLAACRRYARLNPKRQITFEYVLLEGVNDQPVHAHRLARLLHDLPSKVNLIPFNPFPDSGYRRSEPDTVDHFRHILLDEGLMTITRKTRGEDITAACGQLAGQVQQRSGRRHRQPTNRAPQQPLQEQDARPWPAISLAG